jgi:hypothetical protein
MAILPGDWPINASTTSGNDLADKLNRLASGALTAVGGVLTGPLTLAADPAAAMQAATKQYVDAKDVTLQNGIDQAKSDAAAAAAAVGNYVNKAGDIMTGSLRVRSADGYALFATANGEDPFASPYSRFEIKVDAGRAYLGTTSGGGGLNRPLHVVVNAVTRVDVQINGAFTFYNDVGTALAVLDRDGNFSCRGNITAFQPL